jgi:hypothetical protein
MSAVKDTLPITLEMTSHLPIILAQLTISMLMIIINFMKPHKAAVYQLWNLLGWLIANFIMLRLAMTSGITRACRPIHMKLMAIN